MENLNSLKFSFTSYRFSKRSNIIKNKLVNYIYINTHIIGIHMQVDAHTHNLHLYTYPHRFVLFSSLAVID